MLVINLFHSKPGVSYQSKDNLELLPPYRKTPKNLYHAFDGGSENLGDFLPGIGHCVRLINC